MRQQQKKKPKRSTPRTRTATLVVTYAGSSRWKVSDKQGYIVGIVEVTLTGTGFKFSLLRTTGWECGVGNHALLAKILEGIFRANDYWTVTVPVAIKWHTHDGHSA